MQHIYNKSGKPVTLVLYSDSLHNSKNRETFDKVPYLTNGQYELIIDDINTTLIEGNPFRINIYTDASGTVFAKDSNSNDINDRLVITTIYTYAYVDNMNHMLVDGNFKVIFDDGSYIQNDDVHEDIYWYSVVGVTPIVIKQFT
jgi:hypothetical protein